MNPNTDEEWERWAKSDPFFSQRIRPNGISLYPTDHGGHYGFIIRATAGA